MQKIMVFPNVRIKGALDFVLEEPAVIGAFCKYSFLNIYRKKVNDNAYVML
jgi:hypothetical protein